MLKSSRYLVSLLVVVLLAVGVVACGDDEGGDTTQGAAAAQTDTTTPAPSSTMGSAGDERSDGGDSTGKGARKGYGKGGGSSAGSGAAGGGSGSKPSGKVYGDGSIQRYGESASDSDREALFAAATGFYAARAAGDWNRVCELLSQRIVDQLEQLAARAPQLKGADCPKLTKMMIGGVPAQVRRSDANSTRFTDARVDGDSAFAIFESKAIPHGTIPLAREDGEWKVAAIGGSPL